MPFLVELLDWDGKRLEEGVEASSLFKVGTLNENGIKEIIYEMMNHFDYVWYGPDEVFANKQQHVDKEYADIKASANGGYYAPSLDAYDALQIRIRNDAGEVVAQGEFLEVLREDLSTGVPVIFPLNLSLPPPHQPPQLPIPGYHKNWKVPTTEEAVRAVQNNDKCSMCTVPLNQSPEMSEDDPNNHKLDLELSDNLNNLLEHPAGSTTNTVFHIFHRPCIQQWYVTMGMKKCPLCRAKGFGSRKLPKKRRGSKRRGSKRRGSKRRGSKRRGSKI